MVLTDTGRRRLDLYIATVRRALSRLTLDPWRAVRGPLFDERSRGFEQVIVYSADVVGPTLSSDVLKLQQFSQTTSESVAHGVKYGRNPTVMAADYTLHVQELLILCRSVLHA